MRMLWLTNLPNSLHKLTHTVFVMYLHIHIHTGICTYTSHSPTYTQSSRPTDASHVHMYSASSPAHSWKPSTTSMLSPRRHYVQVSEPSPSTIEQNMSSHTQAHSFAPQSLTRQWEDHASYSSSTTPHGTLLTPKRSYYQPASPVNIHATSANQAPVSSTVAVPVSAGTTASAVASSPYGYSKYSEASPSVFDRSAPVAKYANGYATSNGTSTATTYSSAKSAGTSTYGANGVPRPAYPNSNGSTQYATTNSSGGYSYNYLYSPRTHQPSQPASPRGNIGDAVSASPHNTSPNSLRMYTVSFNKTPRGDEAYRVARS